LSLLSTPVNVSVLRALENEPLSLVELRRTVGSVPQTTMHKHLRHLSEAGIVVRRRQNQFPGNAEYALARSGSELISVARAARAWLADSPDGSLSLGENAANRAIKALAAGWSSNMIRAFAARPLSLTELNRLISTLTYPSLERRLGAMRYAGLLEARLGQGRATPYAATNWLRTAIGPLVSAANWERHRAASHSRPIDRIDVESAFLLTVPLLELPTDVSGMCRLSVELRNGGGEPSFAGVLVDIRDGQVVSCVSKLQGGVVGWASGSPISWFDAVLAQDFDGLEIGGHSGLVVTVLDRLRSSINLARKSRSCR